MYHPNTQRLYIYPRGVGESKSSIIIISVVASVGGIILSIFLYRILRILFNLSRYRPTPLPPPQPLAHHREQQIAQFIDRNGNASRNTWYDPHLAAPPMFSTMTGSSSDISLLHGEQRSPTSAPSPHASLGFSESSHVTDEATALDRSPLALPPSSTFPETPTPDSAFDGVDPPSFLRGVKPCAPVRDLHLPLPALALARFLWHQWPAQHTPAVLLASGELLTAPTATCRSYFLHHWPHLYTRLWRLRNPAQGVIPIWMH
jgi:hypothetical protein